MTKLRRTCSFSVSMKFLFFLFFCTAPVRLFAQDIIVDGVVFDKTNKERIAEVNVVNSTTGRSAYNNLKGEFAITATIGDVLIFSKQSYFNDTLKVINYNSTAVYLKRSAIQLRQVNIHDKLVTPEQQLEATKRDYTKIYGLAGNRDLLSISPGGGVGISIDALWNSFSRSGRNAQHLKEVIQRDYYQNVIDFRYNQVLVGRITGLKEPQLTDFMQRYRPGYYFVVEASDYDFIASIKANYKRYLRRPKAFSLQPLVPSK
jgi:hypothetical protein